MTRKDYQLIAKAIQDSKRVCPGDRRSAERYKGIASVAHILAADLAQDNPRFDRARFLKACGIE